MTIQIFPEDVHNKKLIENLHPADWENPFPARKYNLVVIGAGPAGLVTAAGAAGLGAKVALVEKHLMGGDCLNYGCVPSKSLISSARVVQEILSSNRYGIKATQPTVDFSAVMERVHQIRARLSEHDSVRRFTDLGIDVFLGEGQFTGSHTFGVDGKTIRFKKAVIATGARAAEIPIPGLKETGFLTNETVFSLTNLPKRLAVIGGGPIGCELAQAFRKLGSDVTLIDTALHILIREDADAAEILQKILVEDGIRLLLNCSTKKIEQTEQGKRISYEIAGNAHEILVDDILLSVGRAPNVEGLNLETVGVEYDGRRGIKVDDRLRTANEHIYAVGDVCMRYQFTHAADAAARIVIQNALFHGRKKLSGLTIPWCTYTYPEIAHVGLNEAEAARQNISIDTFSKQLKEVDRAIADGVEEGFVKVHVRKGTDTIVGATIVASNAGDMINEITCAITQNIGLSKISAVIHPYPTQAEAIKHVADAYMRTKLAPTVAKILKLWLWGVR